MAVSFVAQHTGQSVTTDGTTMQFTLASSVAAGNVLVVFAVFDNTGTSTPTVSSITGQAGETASWTKIAQHDSSTATSGAGVRGEMWAIRTTTTWATGSYTITLSGSVTSKTNIVSEFSGVTTTLRGTAGTGTSTSGVPTASTGGNAPLPGDLVLGMCGFEANTTPTLDSDTTNGSWSGSTAVANTGTTLTSVAIAASYKIVTATGRQTYNSTGASDSGSCVVALRPVPSGMPLTRVDVQGTSFAASSGSVTVSGVQAGDLIVLLIGGHMQNYANAWTISSLPAGFSLAGGTLTNPTCFVGAVDTSRTGFTVASKIATGGETTLTVTYAISVNSNYTRMIVALVYRGATLAEVVNSSDTANTASTAGTVTAASGSMGISIGAESTATVSGAIDNAVPNTGSIFYFYNRPYISAGLPSVALSEFAVTAGTTLPVTDWTWTGSDGGPYGARGATTLLLAPSAPAASGRPKVWTGSAWVSKPAKVWTGSAWVEKPWKRWDGSTWKTVT